mgnify:CR=1 FL=1
MPHDVGFSKLVFRCANYCSGGELFSAQTARRTINEKESVRPPVTDSEKPTLAFKLIPVFFNSMLNFPSPAYQMITGLVYTKVSHFFLK